MTIVSGGQTGVDRGALDAALDAGAPCGGWSPVDHRAEDGRITSRYPLTPLASGGYRARTRANVRDSDATLVLYPDEPVGGTALTVAIARRLGRPWLLIDAHCCDADEAARQAQAFVVHQRAARLNVAGPRASGWPDGAAYAYACVTALLARHADAATTLTA